MRIYLDNCALGRLTDALLQEQVRTEVQAVERILAGVDAGIHQWIASEILLAEVLRNPDSERRKKAMLVINKANSTHLTTPAILRSAESAVRQGLSPSDAVHLYSAMDAGCEVLLTTDIRFIRQASRLADVPAVYVRNPVDL